MQGREELLTKFVFLLWNFLRYIVESDGYNELKLSMETSGDEGKEVLDPNPESILMGDIRSWLRIAFDGEQIWVIWKLS